MWAYKDLFLSLLLWGVHPEVELLDQMVILFLIFGGTAILFFITVAPCYIPTGSAQKFQFLSTLTNTCYFIYFWRQASEWCEMVSNCDLICIFLMISDVKYLFFFSMQYRFINYISPWLICYTTESFDVKYLYWPSVYLFRKNIYSSPLFIF